LDFTLGQDSMEDGCNDVDRTKKFIQKIQLVHQAIWKRAKPSIRLGMTSIRLIITSKLVIKFGYTLAKKALKVKIKISCQSGMVHLKFWRKLVTMFFGWSYLHICRCIMWLMLKTWNYMNLLWSWIKVRIFKFLLLNIFLLNILMSRGNILFLIERWGHQEEAMWSIFMWA